MTAAAGELVPGFSLPSLTRKISAEDIISNSRGRESLWAQSFAGKNIHNDTETAHSLGARDVVAGGVDTMRVGWEMLFNSFGERWLKGGNLSCTFINWVCGGDELTAKGVVREPAEGDAVDHVYLNIWLENQDGDKVIVGKASVPVN